MKVILIHKSRPRAALVDCVVVLRLEEDFAAEGQVSDTGTNTDPALTCWRKSGTLCEVSEGGSCIAYEVIRSSIVRAVEDIERIHLEAKCSAFG